MSAHDRYVMFGVVIWVLLGAGATTPVAVKKHSSLTRFEMSTAHRLMAEIPGDQTRKRGAGDWLILPSASDELSGVKLHQKRSTNLHPSTIQPIVAGLPADRKGGSGGTEWLVVPSISHKLSSRSIPYRKVTNPPNRYVYQWNGARELPDGRKYTCRGRGGDGGFPIPQMGSVTPPLFKQSFCKYECPGGKKYVRQRCRNVVKGK